MEWLKWSGLIVQVLGLALTCWGLKETYDDHWRGRRTLITAEIRAQTRAVLRWLDGPGRQLEFSGTDTVGVTDSATVTATAATGHGQALPPDVAGDADSLARLTADRLDALTRRVAAEETARHRAAAELRAEIEAGDRAQAELTHESAGGGLRQELVGAALIALGIVLQGIEFVVP